MHGFKTYRKINVSINGIYAYSTSAYKTCREAIAALWEKKSVTVASIPDYTVTITSKDKISAHFAKR